MKKLSNKKNRSLSPSEKKGDLLIQVDDLMNQLENDYGPLMLDELKKRLKKTIEEFQEDVTSVLKEAFEKHESKYKNIGQQVPVLDENEEDVPSYISDYENKKKNKKELKIQNLKVEYHPLLQSIKIKKIKNNSVLDGKLAVSCNLKSAICRVEFQ